VSDTPYRFTDPNVPDPLVVSAQEAAQRTLDSIKPLQIDECKARGDVACPACQASMSELPCPDPRGAYPTYEGVNRDAVRAIVQVQVSWHGRGVLKKVFGVDPDSELSEADFIEAVINAAEEQACK
jgi:hypothetical protein